jgi:hypothetical protein
MAELQVIPARHGTATFVPAGSVIKIINTSGTQVVDTWAFALPKPEPKKGSQEEKAAQDEAKKSQATPTKKKGAGNLPSQEDAEKATEQGMKEGEDANAETDQQKRTWGSYVPSVPSIWGTAKKDETEQKQDSKTWSSYFPSGKGFSNYIPSAAKDTVSSFAATVRLLVPANRIPRLLKYLTAPARSKQELHGTAARILQNTCRGSRSGW